MAFACGIDGLRTIGNRSHAELSMHALIVHAHPEPLSMNAALKDAAVRTLAECGVTVAIYPHRPMASQFALQSVQLPTRQRHVMHRSPLCRRNSSGTTPRSSGASSFATYRSPSSSEGNVRYKGFGKRPLRRTANSYEDLRLRFVAIRTSLELASTAWRTA